METLAIVYGLTLDVIKNPLRLVKNDRENGHHITFFALFVKYGLARNASSHGLRRTLQAVENCYHLFNKQIFVAGSEYSFSKQKRLENHLQGKYVRYELRSLACFAFIETDHIQFI